MAGEDGDQTEAITLMQELQREPYRFGFFQAVRRINCAFPESALTGTSYRPADDPVRFAQTAHSGFAPSTLHSVGFEGPGNVPRISQMFMGLFGPNGPLPIHLTEYAILQRMDHDSTFEHFADMFHHRMVSLFYRAWAQAQPCVQHDRPQQDRFSLYIGSLMGLGMPSFRRDDGMQHMSKLHYAGHFASLPRHAAGLASIIESFFGVPARIVEFVAHWLRIPRRDRLRLGAEGTLGRLGESVVLGERVWQRQDKFQIRLGPLSLQEYEDFLPAGRHYPALVAAVRNYLGLELLWEVHLVLKGTEKPATCLGKQGVLGWTSWLQSSEPTDVVEDLVLQTANYPV